MKGMMESILPACLLCFFWLGVVSAGPGSHLRCTDHLGNFVEDGTVFAPNNDDCYTCRCDDGFPVACTSVLCSPPDCEHPRPIEGVCCKFVCVDSNGDVTSVGNSNDTIGDPILPGNGVQHADTANLSLRLVASTVTSFLILALLLFMVHRLRQRRTLVMMRRLNNQRQEDEMVAYMPQMDQVDIGIEFPPYEDPPPPYSPPKPPFLPMGEAPPPYEDGNGVANGALPYCNGTMSRNGAVTQERHRSGSGHIVGAGMTFEQASTLLARGRCTARHPDVVDDGSATGTGGDDDVTVARNGGGDATRGDVTGCDCGDARCGGCGGGAEDAVMTTGRGPSRDSQATPGRGSFDLTSTSDEDYVDCSSQRTSFTSGLRTPSDRGSGVCCRHDLHMRSPGGEPEGAASPWGRHSGVISEEDDPPRDYHRDGDVSLDAGSRASPATAMTRSGEDSLGRNRDSASDSSRERRPSPRISPSPPCLEPTRGPSPRAQGQGRSQDQPYRPKPHASAAKVSGSSLTVAGESGGAPGAGDRSSVMSRSLDCSAPVASPVTQFIKRSKSIEIRRGSTSPRNSFLADGEPPRGAPPAGPSSTSSSGRGGGGGGGDDGSPCQRCRGTPGGSCIDGCPGRRRGTRRPMSCLMPSNRPLSSLPQVQPGDSPTGADNRESGGSGSGNCRDRDPSWRHSQPSGRALSSAVDHRLDWDHAQRSRGGNDGHEPAVDVHGDRPPAGGVHVPGRSRGAGGTVPPASLDLRGWRLPGGTGAAPDQLTSSDDVTTTSSFSNDSSSSSSSDSGGSLSSFGRSELGGGGGGRGGSRGSHQAGGRRSPSGASGRRRPAEGHPRGGNGLPGPEQRGAIRWRSVDDPEGAAGPLPSDGGWARVGNRHGNGNGGSAESQSHHGPGQRDTLSPLSPTAGPMRSVASHGSLFSVCSETGEFRPRRLPPTALPLAIPNDAQYPLSTQALQPAASAPGIGDPLDDNREGPRG